MPPEKARAALLLLLALLLPANATIAAYASDSGTHGLDSPKLRFFDNGSGAWGPETELGPSGSQIRFISMASRPSDSALAIATQDGDGAIGIYTCMADCSSPGSWSHHPGAGDVGSGGQRRFALAFDAAGSGMLLYAINERNSSRDLAYRLLDGNLTPGPEQYLDDAGHGNNIQYMWVELAANPGGGMIAAALDNTNDDINAWVWDGASWGNPIEITPDAASSSGALAVACPNESGICMAMGASGSTGDVSYSMWNGTSWSAVSSFDIDAGDAFDAQWITLKPAPLQNTFQAVIVDNGRDLHTAYWNGSWHVSSDIETGLDTSNQRPADFEWLSGASGMLIWDSDGASGDTLNTINCSPDCNGTPATVSSYAKAGRWLSLRRNPFSGELLGARLNSQSSLGSFSFNGTAFAAHGDDALTADAGSVNYECYDIVFLPPESPAPQPPPANISILKLDQTALQPSPGGVVQFNITVTTTGNVSLNGTVADSLPGGLTFASASPANSSAGPVWGFTGLEPGQTISYYINATVDAGAVNSTVPIRNLTNLVTVNAIAPNGDNVTDGDSARVGVYAPAINLIKTVNQSNATIGENVTYTLNVTNTGSINLTITVTDTLPENMTFNGADVAPANESGQTVIWADIAVLPPGESFAISYNASANSAGILANNATAEGTPPNGDAVSDSSSASIISFAPPQEPEVQSGRIRIAFSSSCEENIVAVESGGPLEGARVVVTDRETGETVASGRSDDGGIFVFEGCGVGVSIRASKSGFEPKETTARLVDCFACAIELEKEPSPAAVPEATEDGTGGPAAEPEGEPDSLSCLYDSDCTDAEYCDRPPGAESGTCEYVDGCGIVLAHRLVPYECGDGAGCPTCAEGYACNYGTCINRMGLQAPGNGFVDDDATILAFEDDEPCAGCELSITTPSGEVLRVAANSSGAYTLRLGESGEYRISLNVLGRPLRTAVISVQGKPAASLASVPNIFYGLQGLLFVLGTSLALTITAMVHIEYDRRNQSVTPLPPA